MTVHLYVWLLDIFIILDTCNMCFSVRKSSGCHPDYCCDSYSETDQFNRILNAKISQWQCKLGDDISALGAEHSAQIEDIKGGVNGHKNMAIVLYKPKHLSEFRQETKTFTFAGKTVTIQQKWEEYGVAAVVWDSAVVLAEYLEKCVKEHQLVLKGKSVIELGAGTGLVGIVASLLEGSVVTTDRSVVLDQLRANVDANVPQTGGKGGITVEELSWGENLHKFPETFDLVVGADIVYLEDTFPQLIRTIIHLSSKTTLVLLSCRIRYARDERFLDMMREHFVLAEILNDKSRNIHVFRAYLIH